MVSVANADAVAGVIADVFGWIVIIGWIATAHVVARLWFDRPSKG